MNRINPTEESPIKDIPLHVKEAILMIIVELNNVLERGMISDESIQAEVVDNAMEEAVKRVTALINTWPRERLDDMVAVTLTKNTFHTLVPNIMELLCKGGTKLVQTFMQESIARMHREIAKGKEQDEQE
jgi:hypothetical protein